MEWGDGIMKKLTLILAVLLIWPTVCGAWSFNDFTDEMKAKLDAIFVTGGSTGDVLTQQEDGTFAPATPTGGTGSGDVTGPSGATAGNLPMLDATGKILSDSGKAPGDFLESETDPGLATHESTYTHANIATCYGWGNHAEAGYVTGTPWAGMGYLTAETDPDFTTWLSTFTDQTEDADADPTNEIQVADGITITGDGSIGNPFVAVGGEGPPEADPVFSEWLSTFDPFEASDETDQVFSAWLLATPPIYTETDPTVDLTKLQGLVTNDFHNLGGTDATGPTYSFGTGLSEADGYVVCTIVDTNTTYSSSDFDVKDLTDSTSLRSTWSGKQDTLGFTPVDSADTTATPTANKIPIADANGLLDGWITTPLYLEVDGSTTNEIQTASEVLITDTNDRTDQTTVEGWLDEIAGSVSGFVSNVSTSLSIGTKTATTVAITSDGSMDDVVLPEATTDEAGLLGADKYDEIVSNTSARHADESYASTTVAGVIEIADETESLAGTASDKAMAPAGVSAYVAANGGNTITNISVSSGSTLTITGNTIVDNTGQSGSMVTKLPSCPEETIFIQFFQTVATQTWYIQPETNTHFWLSGTELSDNHKIVNNGAASIFQDSIIFESKKDASGNWHWCCYVVQGTWTDGGL